MKKIKSEKGISLVILLLTIIVMAILATIAVGRIDVGQDIRNYNNMCADIELLSNKVLVYYRTNNSLPITGEPLEDIDLEGQESSRDNSNYYQIDISELSNITLKYGGGNATNGDIYIINEQSHEIYYLKGVTLEGNKYYKQK